MIYFYDVHHLLIDSSISDLSGTEKMERPISSPPGGRSNIPSGEKLWENVTLHHRTIPVLEACTSPYTALFFRSHVAAFFALEGFSERREILKRS